jgi:SAM-dependent methyltransferase
MSKFPVSSTKKELFERVQAPTDLGRDPKQSLKPCILCGGTAVKRLYMQAHFPVVKCVPCGLTFADEHFKQEDLDSFYSGDYYQRAYVCHPPEIDSKVAADYVKAFRRVAKDGTSGRLLDFGSARGTFLGELKARAVVPGWDLEGIDINADEIAMGLAVGNPVRCGSVDESNPPEGSYDAVTAFSVLEHLQDPIGIMKNLSRILKVGGHLVAIVPSGSCLILDLALLSSRLLGKRAQGFCDNVFHEEHLYYFTRKTMTEALRRAGLEPTQWFYTPSYLEIHPPNPLIALPAYGLRLTSWLMRKQTMLGVVAQKR